MTYSAYSYMYSFTVSISVGSLTQSSLVLSFWGPNSYINFKNFKIK